MGTFSVGFSGEAQNALKRSLSHWKQWNLCGPYYMRVKLNYYAAQSKTEKELCFGYNMPTGSINWVQNHG